MELIAVLIVAVLCELFRKRRDTVDKLLALAVTLGRRRRRSCILATLALLVRPLPRDMRCCGICGRHCVLGGEVGRLLALDDQVLRELWRM